MQRPILDKSLRVLNEMPLSNPSLQGSGSYAEEDMERVHETVGTEDAKETIHSRLNSTEAHMNSETQW